MRATDSEVHHIVIYNVYVMGICICQQEAYYFAHKDLDFKVLCLLLGVFFNTYQYKKGLILFIFFINEDDVGNSRNSAVLFFKTGYLTLFHIIYLWLI